MRKWDLVFEENGKRLRESVTKVNASHDLKDAERTYERMDELLAEAIILSDNDIKKTKLKQFQSKIESEKEMISQENVFTDSTKEMLQSSLNEICDLYDELNYFIGI